MKHKITLMLISCILASSFVSASIISHSWDTEPKLISGDFSNKIQLNLDNAGVCDAKRYFYLGYVSSDYFAGYYYPGLNVNPLGICIQCPDQGTFGISSTFNVLSGLDPFSECNTSSTAALGCATGNCNGLGACGAYSSGDQSCPQCYRCSDGDVACEYYSHNQDDGCGTCRTCNGAGACHYESNGEDVKSECNTGSTSALGCATGNCNGAGACGAYSTGDQSCPQCQRCSDSDVACEYYTHNQDDGCGTCRTCNGAGACHYENNGEDIKGDCPAYSCSDEIRGWSGNSCQRYNAATANNGDCNGGGDCNSLSASCTGAVTTATCGSSGCTKACPIDGAVSSYNSISEVCYTSGQRGCSSGYECDSSGTCVTSCTAGDYYSWSGTCSTFCAGIGGSASGVGGISYVCSLSGCGIPHEGCRSMNNYIDSYFSGKHTGSCEGQQIEKYNTVRGYRWYDVSMCRCTC